MNTVLVIVIAVTLLGLAGVLMVMLRRKFITELAQIKTELGEMVSSGTERLGDHIGESLRAGRSEQREVLQLAVQSLERKFTALQGTVDHKLTQTVSANRQDLAAVTERLTKLHEATGQIVALSKGVNELHTLMKTPKLRGSFGEWTLERMLEEVLGQEGHTFRRQFTLAGGERADAAVFTRPGGEQVVCVDSKFPATQAQLLLSDELTDEQRLASERQFRKDVQGHAKAIAQKYIRPPQTLDFAFMFIPSESVFQLVLCQRQLHEKLLQMNVIPTSPNSFYAYLQALAFALRGLKIQQSAIEVQQQIGRIAGDFEKFAKSYATLGTHLGNASSKYEETLLDINRFRNRVEQIQALPPQDGENQAGDRKQTESSDTLLKPSLPDQHNRAASA